MAKKITVGIVGLGSFGEFLVSLMPKDVVVCGFDQDSSKGPKSLARTDLAGVADMDIIILAIPLESYDAILTEIALMLKSKPETLIIDVCSVKVLPEKLLNQYIPNHPNLLLTHPLFGAQSASDGTKGHKLVVTQSKGEKANQVLDFCRRRLELDILTLTSDEHDKYMANVHVLTFFVARGLSKMNIESGPFNTPSYKMIMDLIKFDKTHTEALFSTIQAGNPYAKEVRQQLIDSLKRVDDNLKSLKTETDR